MVTATTGWWQPLWWDPSAGDDDDPTSPEDSPWRLTVRCERCGMAAEIAVVVAPALMDDPAFDCVAYLEEKADTARAQLARAHPCLGATVLLRSATTGAEAIWDVSDPYGYDTALAAITP